MPTLPRRSVLYAAIAGLPALAVAGVWIVEPELRSGSSPGSPGEVVGVVHVHTVASDGGGTVDQVLEAASAGGLDFVVLTDHNRWGAPAWAYHDAVLLIVGEEVNTHHGHLLVVGGGPVGDRRRNDRSGSGDPGGSPAPAVAPHEGLRVAAHPTGRAPWTGWEGEEFDGIEIWNADTERRNDRLTEWLRAVALAPLRPVAGLYRLLDHPTEELALWDRLLEERPVFGVCAVDAHHTLPLNRSRTVDLHFPAYRHSFALARQHVLLEGGLTADPVVDGHAVLRALARGRSFCAFDGLADARGARFAVRSGGLEGTLGDSIGWSPGARLEVALPEWATAVEGEVEVTVVRDGRRLDRWDPARASGVALPGPGIYRVEVTMDRAGARLPWILTNPFWMTRRTAGS